MQQTEKSFDIATLRPPSGIEKPKAAESVAGSERPSVEEIDVTIAGEEHEYLEGLKLFSTIISITLVGFLVLLDTAIVSTAIPRITDRFHSLDDVGWYGTAYLLAKSVVLLLRDLPNASLTIIFCSCAVQPLTGKIYTHFSNKAGIHLHLFLFQ